MSLESTYKYIDSKHAEFTVKDPEDHQMYFLYVHKKATIDEKYAGGMYDKGTEDLSEPQLKISSDRTEFYAYEKNPTFTVSIKNGEFSQTIDNSMITLSQGFAQLEITQITRTSDTILTIFTSGEIIPRYDIGELQFTPGTIENVTSSVIINTKITEAQSFADLSKLNFQNNVLTFEVLLTESTFNDTPAITVNNNNSVTINSIKTNKGRTSATIKLNVNANDIDSALSIVKGTEFTISAQSTDYNNEIVFSLIPCEATLNAVVDYIEKSSDNSYQATFVLSAINGTLGEIAKEDIKISDNFTNAEVTSVEKTNAGTKVAFTFTSTKEISESTYNGIITITDGKLENPWGTKSSDNDADLYFASQEYRDLPNQSLFADFLVDDNTASTAEKCFAALGQFWKNYGSKAATGLSVGLNIFNASKIILEMTGLVESTNAKLDKVYDAVLSMQSDLDNRLSQIQSKLSEIEDKVDITRLTTTSTAWNDFYTKDYADLLTKINYFNNIVESNSVGFLNGPKSITVYYNTKGEVTIPSEKNPDVAFDGCSIDKSRTQTYVFTEDQLIDIIKKTSNGTKAYDNYLDDLQKTFVNVYRNVGNDIYQSFILQLNFNAINDPTVVGIGGIFIKVCNYLLGTSQSKKPLDYFDEMLSYSYNFDSQTSKSKATMRAALSANIVEGFTIASIEKSYKTPLSSDTTLDKCEKNVEAYLKNNTGKIQTRDGTQWCNVTNSELKLGYFNFVHGNNKGYHVRGTQGVAEIGDSHGYIIGSDVSDTMLAYGDGPVSTDQMRRMLIISKGHGKKLRNDLLEAGFDKNLVYKSNFISTSALKGNHRTKVTGDTLFVSQIVHDSSKFYFLKQGIYFTENTPLDDRWAITSDITYTDTNSQTHNDELLVIGYLWKYNFFEANNEIYFDSNLNTKGETKYYNSYILRFY